MKKGFAVTLFVALVLLVWYVFGNHYQNNIMKVLGILAILSIVAISFGVRYSKIDKGTGRILSVFGALNFFIIYIVLASFNGHPKGYTAALKASLANARIQALIIHEQTTPNSFNGICSDESITKLLNTDYVKIHTCVASQDSFVIAAESNAASFKRNYSSKRADVYACVDLNNLKEISEEQYTGITSANTFCP